MTIVLPDSLHHAYLVPGEASEAAELFSAFALAGLPTLGSSDFFLKEADTFTIDDAREIKAFQGQSAVGKSGKVIVIVTEYFSREAQHALLKVFEEPAKGVHFFILTPHTEILLPTLLSRLFYLKASDSPAEDATIEKDAEAFLGGDKDERLAVISRMIKAHENDETIMGLKKRASSFLRSLERKAAQSGDVSRFDMEALWKVRDYMNDQGSSVKNLLETLALVF